MRVVVNCNRSRNAGNGGIIYYGQAGGIKKGRIVPSPNLLAVACPPAEDNRAQKSVKNGSKAPVPVVIAAAGADAQPEEPADAAGQV